MKFLRILILLPVFCFGQVNHKPVLNASAGCNISRHYLMPNNSLVENSQPLPLDRGAGFNFGLNGLFPVWRVICVKSSLSLSWMSSTSEYPFFKLRNQYLESSLCAATRFRDEIIFSAGINYAKLLSSEFLRLDQESNWQAYDTYLYRSQESVDAGMELKLEKNFSLLFDYFIPLRQFDTKNFRAGINVHLTGRSKSAPSPRIAARENAIAQINELKNGTLLVRLHASENKIAAMTKQGKQHQAERTEQNQKEANKKIVTAFRQRFNFCPIRFFYSSNSEKVLSKNFSGIFLNDDLTPDSSITIDTAKKVFVAEFTTVRRDSAEYFSGYRLERDTILHLEKTYYGGPDEGFYALVISDGNLNQLRRPFPYFSVASFRSILAHPESFFVLPYVINLRWSYKRVVERMNNKLIENYESTNK